MGFRFRKSVKLMPGVRLNIGKTGISASVGGKGATVNVGKRGVRGTVGIPGTGISYSEDLTPGRSKQSPISSQASSDIDPVDNSKGIPLTGLITLVVLGIAVFSCVTR